MSKKISIYDIAKYVGVSPATVSYAINGKKKISLETKQKIFKAIDELCYVPDTMARTLTTGRSHLIGLCLPIDDSSSQIVENPFYVEFISGLELGIAKFDYDIVIGCQENKNDFKSWARSRRLDGVIMLGKYPRTVYESIKELNIPIVLIDVYEEYANEFHNIRVDDEGGMYEATNFMIKNGHTKIGFAGAIDKSLVDYHRYLGYRRALEDNHVEYQDDFLFSGYATFDSGCEIAKKIIQRNNITAICCSGDIIGIGIIRTYCELGKKIPEELSVIGFDDIQDDKYLFPSLTTMSQDIRLKGQLAAKTIIENTDNSNNSFSMVNLGAKLVERDTVKKLN